VHRSDDPLLPPVVAQGAAGSLDPGGQRRLGDEARSPDLLEQLLLGHHAVAMHEEVAHHFEHLRLDVDHRPGAPQLERLHVDLDVAEPERHLWNGRSGLAGERLSSR
jgi:hypothetical protein